MPKFACKDSSPGLDGIPYSIIKGFWCTFGPILLDAWKFSLTRKCLPPSHRISFLKLIPKAEKDSKFLKNWRPITLSNCDHKIITKTYSRRMCDAVSTVIRERQTAYVKGRLINDNLRGLIASIKVANSEEDIDGLIVSLDAKKAFDSVEHSYIEECLIKFGLPNFVPIFKLLYTELRSDIIINGRVVKGYHIKRGVKQGDALSCILFIMCMEPLLRNIEANDAIEPISSVKLNSNLPKVYAYADDVNGVIKNTQAGVQALFNEYERLSLHSGLELNADKTEILRLRSSNLDANVEKVRIRYLEIEYEIEPCEKTKINGLFLQQDEKKLTEENVRMAINRMEMAFRRWTRRGLSTLGKILIVKTYGISQIIYLLQSFKVDDTAVKKINAVLYKFIWNKHFLAPKAPDRIRREIVNKPIALSGLGMLDIRELDESLKLKALGRLLISTHPFLKIIKNRINMEEFFYPGCKTDYDEVASAGVDLLKKDRQTLMLRDELEGNRLIIGLIKDIKINRVLKKGKENSILIFNLRLNGRNKIGQLTREQLRSLRPLIIPVIYNKIDRILNLPGSEIPEELKCCYFLNKSFKNLSKLTSKEFRLSRAEKEPICLFKIGLILTPNEGLNWLDKVRKLTSTKLKDTILRIAHGEIYTRIKLHKYGLIDSPACPRCGENETLQHKFLLCEYVKEIWKHTLRVTNKIRLNKVPTGNLDFDDPSPFLAAKLDDNLATLTVQAEVLRRLLILKEDQNYLIHPRVLIRLILLHLIKREGNRSLKEELQSLLDD